MKTGLHVFEVSGPSGCSWFHGAHVYTCTQSTDDVQEKFMNCSTELDSKKCPELLLGYCFTPRPLPVDMRQRDCHDQIQF